MKQVIGTRDFTDGSQRAVYEDDDGRQFVINDEGKGVYGIWILADQPLAIVDLDADAEMRCVAHRATRPCAETSKWLTNQQK